jgi:hypothetical protein
VNGKRTYFVRVLGTSHGTDSRHYDNLAAARELYDYTVSLPHANLTRPIRVRLCEVSVIDEVEIKPGPKEEPAP